jgi:hypothetical protein
MFSIKPLPERHEKSIGFSRVTERFEAALGHLSVLSRASFP